MAKPIPIETPETSQVLFPVPPVVTQAEIVNVLRLRSHFNQIQFELENAQSDLMKKLAEEARIEAGAYVCVDMNCRLMIWKNSEYTPKRRLR